MNCIKCDKNNPANSKFCVYCGNEMVSANNQINEQTSDSGNPSKDIDAKIGELDRKIELILNALSEHGIIKQPIDEPRIEVPNETIRKTQTDNIPVTSDEDVTSDTPVKYTNCNSCGHQNEFDSTFCTKCGSSLQIQQDRFGDIYDTSIDDKQSASEDLSEEVPVATETKSAVHSSQSFILDSWLGRNWLAGIGIVSIIIGVIFLATLSTVFLWIVPPILAIAFLILSEFWKTKYAKFAQALCGGSVGILYAYSWVFWEIPTIPIIITLITSALAAILALRHNSSYIAILGIIGAFLTPNILNIQKINFGIDIGVIIYLIAVNISVIALATFKTWRWFTLLALIGTLATFYSWYYQIGVNLAIIQAQLSLTVLFLIFAAATTLFHLIWKKPSNGFDYILMVINALGYLLLSYLIMYDSLSDWMGLFTLSIASVYLAISIISYFRIDRHNHLTLMSIGLTVTLITTAIAVQFGDQHHWRTVFWSVHAAVLMLLAAKLSMKPLKFVSLIILGLTMVSIIADSFEAFTKDYPRLNPYLASYLLTAVAFYAAAFISHKTIKTENLSIISSVLPRIVDKYTTRIFLASGNIVVAIGTAVLLENPWISLGFAIKAALLVFLGETFKNNNLRWLSIPSLILSIVWILSFDAVNASSLSLTEALNTYLLPYILTLSFILITAYYIYRNRITDSLPHRIMFPMYLYSGIALSIIAPLVFDDTAWHISIIWSIQSIVFILVSHKFRLIEFDLSNLILIIALTGKLILFDLITHISSDNIKPVWNYTILSFLVGILAIYFSAYITKKWDFQNPLKMKMPDLEHWIVPKKYILVSLIVTANILTFCILNVEVIKTIDYFFVNVEDLKNIKSLSLSLVWATYAIIIISTGIIIRLSKVRLVGIGLMFAPIIKLYTYDLWYLENVYKVSLFITLGLIFLISGFLYQKYTERIKEFLSDDSDSEYNTSG